MKIAVISDIHGNIEALEEAFSNIQNRNLDTIVCLGDLVGYGPYPNEVVEYLNFYFECWKMPLQVPQYFHVCLK